MITNIMKKQMKFTCKNQEYLGLYLSHLLHSLNLEVNYVVKRRNLSKIIILLIKDFKLMILDMIKLILIPKISNNNTIKAKTKIMIKCLYKIKIINSIMKIRIKNFLTKNK